MVLISNCRLWRARLPSRGGGQGTPNALQRSQQLSYGGDLLHYRGNKSTTGLNGWPWLAFCRLSAHVAQGSGLRSEWALGMVLCFWITKVLLAMALWVYHPISSLHCSHVHASIAILQSPVSYSLFLTLVICMTAEKFYRNIVSIIRCVIKNRHYN